MHQSQRVFIYLMKLERGCSGPCRVLAHAVSTWAGGALGIVLPQMALLAVSSPASASTRDGGVLAGERSGSGEHFQPDDQPEIREGSGEARPSRREHGSHSPRPERWGDAECGGLEAGCDNVGRAVGLQLHLLCVRDLQPGFWRWIQRFWERVGLRVGWRKRRESAPAGRCQSAQKHGTRAVCRGDRFLGSRRGSTASLEVRLGDLTRPLLHLKATAGTKGECSNRDLPLGWNWTVKAVILRKSEQLVPEVKMAVRETIRDRPRARGFPLELLDLHTWRLGTVACGRRSI